MAGTVILTVCCSSDLHSHIVIICCGVGSLFLLWVGILLMMIYQNKWHTR